MPGGVWLGYAKNGGRLFLSMSDLKRGIVLIGAGSDEIAVGLAFSCHESGLRTVVIDLNGGACESLSGHLAAYSIPYFLLDAMKVDGNLPSLHAQLIASAYSTALDLSFEQEAILEGVCQQIALEEGVASPTALAERMELQELSGNATKRLKTRLNSLSQVSVTGNPGSIFEFSRRGALLNFREAMNLEAGELCASLVIAKLLTISWNKESDGPEVVVVPGANRLFRGRPIFRQNLRLLSTLAAAPFARIFSSEPIYGVDHHFTDIAATRILSSGSWNDPKKSLAMPPGMFMMRNSARGFEEMFVPRTFHPKSGPLNRGRADPQEHDDDLDREILESVRDFDDSTVVSLTAFISPGRSKEEVEKEVARLVGESFLVFSEKEASGQRHTVLRLTDKGRERLGRNP